MPSTQDIVQKLWNLCNILRDDGITYLQYVTELTYLLFLKLAKETGIEDQLPKGHRWDDIRKKDGIPLLEAKFRTNLARIFAAKQQKAIWDVCNDAKRLEAMPVNEFVDLFAL